jgi:hypothetical protein
MPVSLNLSNGISYTNRASSTNSTTLPASIDTCSVYANNSDECDIKININPNQALN